MEQVSKAKVNVSDSTSENSYHGQNSSSSPKTRNPRARYFRTRGKMRNAWKLVKLRKLWEKDYAKNRTIPAPFVSIQVHNKRESMLASLIFLFAIMQCICGFIFPICDTFALTDSRTQLAIDHKYYLEVFLLAQYVGAILVLAYLQILIWIHSRTSPTSAYINSPISIDGDAVGRKYGAFYRNYEASEVQLAMNSEGSNQLELNEVNSISFAEENAENISLKSPTTRFKNQIGVTPARMPSVSSNLNLFESNRKETPITWHPEGMNLYLRLGAVGFGLGVMIHDGFNLSSTWEIKEPICHSYLWIPKHLLRLTWVMWQTYFIFKYHRVIFQTHVLRVRLAYVHLAAVNFCHWLKVVISEVANTLQHEDMIVLGHSKSDNTGIHSSSNVIEHDIIGHFTQTIWNGTTPASVNHSSSDTHVVSSTFPNQNRSICKGHLGEMVAPFLFPLAIEYSLITGSFFYKMLQRVEHKVSTESMDAIRALVHSQSTPSLASHPHFSCGLSSEYGEGKEMFDAPTGSKPCLKHTRYRQMLGCLVYLPVTNPKEMHLANSNLNGKHGAEENSSELLQFPYECENRSHSFAAHCHRSHSGLFLGIMLLIASIVAMVLFITREKAGHVAFAINIYQQSKIVLSSLGLIACILAIIQTNYLKFRPLKRGESFEYNLLSIGLIGCLIYHMFLFMPSLETSFHLFIYDIEDIPNNGTLTTNPYDNGYIAYVYMAKCSLEIIQALVQFFFIVEASRRGPCCTNQALIKPGRSAIVFLLIVNLALWLMNTFEVREAENQLPLHRQYFGVRTWSVITCCFIPLIIFFRFHSTVCMAELWSKLYKPKFTD